MIKKNDNTEIFVPLLLLGAGSIALALKYMGKIIQLSKGIVYPVKPLVVTSKFGYRIHPVTKKYAFHNGIDIKGREGTPIYATTDGIVEKVFSNEIGGKQVVIRYPKLKVKMGYAHLKDVFVKTGQKVKRGQKIGTIGKTGRVTGSHLHLTIKDLSTNKYIDPQLFFA